jgi:hypothetical protein
LLAIAGCAALLGTASPASAGTRGGSGSAWGDFDGNGVYGASQDLPSRRSQLWHQDRNRIRQEAEPGDRLGTLTRFLD